MFNFFSATPMALDLFTGLMPVGPQQLSAHFPTPGAEVLQSEESISLGTRAPQEHLVPESRPGLLDPLLLPVGVELETT